VNQLIQNHPYQCIALDTLTFKGIVGIALLVLILSLATAYILSLRKAKRKGEILINATSKRAFLNFVIPMITGGILVILLLKHSYYGLIAPMTLIFYGLACVNVSKYTFRDVRYLGITEIILGLISMEFPGYGLLFWTIGFGILHIVYGTVMYFKYDK